MESIVHFFHVDNTALTVLNYPISWIELIATIANGICVILCAKKRISNYAFGFVSAVLTAILFYQLRLYADFTLNITFFTFTQIIGWVLWSKHQESKDVVKTRSLTTRAKITIAGIFLVSWALATLFYMNCHTLLPFIFPEPAAAPLFDSLVLVGSVIGQILMLARFRENWLLWLLVNSVAIFVYWHNGARLMSIEYIFFWGNAFYGYWKWGRK